VRHPLLCGFASTEGMLIVFRFIQGVGGAVASACILGMVATMHSDPRKQAQAIGALQLWPRLAVAPSARCSGAFFTGLVSWNWIFFINVPIGAAVIVLALRAVRKDQGLEIGRRADYFGCGAGHSRLMLPGLHHCQRGAKSAGAQRKR